LYGVVSAVLKKKPTIDLFLPAVLTYTSGTHVAF